MAIPGWEPAFGSDNLEILASPGAICQWNFGVVLREILLRAAIDFQRVPAQYRPEASGSVSAIPKFSSITWYQ